MGATEEQMLLVAGSPMDHVSYILILFSMAFLLFLFSNMLVHLYDRLTSPASDTKPYANGYHPPSRHVEEGRVGGAEEFELEGLTSDDEEDEGKRMLRRSGEAHGAGSANAPVSGRP